MTHSYCGLLCFSSKRICPWIVSKIENVGHHTCYGVSYACTDIYMYIDECLCLNTHVCIGSHWDLYDQCVRRWTFLWMNERRKVWRMHMKAVNCANSGGRQKCEEGAACGRLSSGMNLLLISGNPGRVEEPHEKSPSVSLNLFLG